MIITTRIPAHRHSVMAAGTSGLTGSFSATSPTNSMSCWPLGNSPEGKKEQVIITYWERLYCEGRWPLHEFVIVASAMLMDWAG